jgi:NADPH-dependent curcumin reductase
MNTKIENRRWLLKNRPVEASQASDFVKEIGSVPTNLKEGDVLVKSLYWSFDASQRIWLTQDGGYMDPIAIGDAMRTVGIGRVIKSRHPDYAEGQIVEGFMAWEDYVIMRADGLMPLQVLPDASIPLTWFLGVLGISGLTAYLGLTEGLNIKKGENLVVSAAVGSLGSLVAGMAKQLGAGKVVGIAGGSEKCRWLTEVAGYDAAIDYKNDDIAERLADLFPNGVDNYFDNVGGDILDEMFLHMRVHGKILICGAMSSGYTGVKLIGPTNYMRICTHNLLVKGILLAHHAQQIPEAIKQISTWLEQGLLHVEENIVEGFDNAPSILPSVFAGKAPGRLILKVD